MAWPINKLATKNGILGGWLVYGPFKFLGMLSLLILEVLVTTDTFQRPFLSFTRLNLNQLVLTQSNFHWKGLFLSFFKMFCKKKFAVELNSLQQIQTNIIVQFHCFMTLSNLLVLSWSRFLT